MRNTPNFFIPSIMCVVGLAFAPAQHSAGLQEQVRAYRVAHEREIVREFSRLLSLPNRASDSRDIELNAEFIKTMLESRGITVRVLRVK